MEGEAATTTTITETVVTITETTREVSLGKVALVLILVLLLAYLATRHVLGIGNRRRITLLVGPAGSGKTTLFRQFQNGKPPALTVTSVRANECECGVSGDRPATDVVKVADYPGHVKLRSGCGAYLDRAKRIVFVTDALVYNQSDRVREAASFLFEVLKHPSVLRDRVPVLIACNKSERMNAFSPEFVKKRLEKEIEVLLSTQGDLSDTVGGAEGNANIASTKEGQAFKVSDCYSKVTAAAVSASKGTIKPIRQFITS